MVHSVRLKSTDSLIIVVENQHDYEEALKYVAGTEYEVVSYDTMVQNAEGNGNLIIITSPDIKEVGGDAEGNK